ncbi:hypothetical protein MD484_g2279, partial [Candolleomyces efflorescens]
MSDHSSWYNGLPSVEEADALFIDRAKWFSKLAPILGREEYEGKYTLCLVHRHVKLEQGERMVAIGLTTAPEKVPPSDIDVTVCPSAWTAAGRPFEWQRVDAPEQRVPAPPPELLEDFAKIAGENSVLGLSSAVGLELAEGEIWWESIDYPQRRHILQSAPRERPELPAQRFLETCWAPTRTHSPSMAAEVVDVLQCCVICPSSIHHPCEN